MQAEDFVFHNSSEGKEVEQVGVLLPHVGAAVLSHALIIKTIHLCDLPRFMISTKNSNAIRPSELECNQQTHAFHGIVTSVNIVAHKQVVGVREMASDSEKLH